MDRLDNDVLDLATEKTLNKKVNALKASMAVISTYDANEKEVKKLTYDKRQY